MIWNERDGVHVVLIDLAELIDDAAVWTVRRPIDELLSTNTVKRLVLDFSYVTLAGTAAFGMLVRIKTRCTQFDCGLRLCGMSPPLLEVMHITRLDTIFHIHKNAQEAIDAFLAP